LVVPGDANEARPPKTDGPWKTFIDWLSYRQLLRLCGESCDVDTPVGPGGRQRLIDDAKNAITELTRDFVAEWEGLVTLARDEGLQEGGKSRMAVELRRMCGNFCWAVLPAGFLPGHGFPTNVVSFMPGKEFKAPQDTPQDGARQFRTVVHNDRSISRSATTRQDRKSFSTASSTSQPESH